MNKALLLALMMGTASAHMPENPQECINALEYLRDENRKAADKLEQLYLITDDAIDKASMSQAIDALLQSFVYLAERIKHYQEHYSNIVMGLYKGDES